MTHCKVVNEKDKKTEATRFLDAETADVWEVIPEFKSDSTYELFKAAVRKLYPLASDDRKYTLADLDALVGRYLRTGFSTIEDLTEFHQQFLAISSFLIGRGMIAVTKQ